MSRDDPDFIDAVEKAFRVMEAFSAERPALTVSQAAGFTGLTRPTVRRLLLTFTRLGFAETDGREFRLTPHVLRLGYAYLSSTPVWERALPHMRALADSVKESVSLAVLDGPEIVYVARVPAARSMTITLTVGSRLPAYPTSMGRVLLADLPDAELETYLKTVRLDALTPHTLTDRTALRAELHRVREQGYAMIDGEREEGVRSAAAAVRDGGQAASMALNVSANAARVPLQRLREEFVPQLIAAAELISREGALSKTR